MAISDRATKIVIFIFLLFLFGLASGGTQVKTGTAVGQKAAYWQNVVVDTLGASDDRYAYIYGYDGYDTMYVSDFDFSVSADSSLDSVVFRIEYSRTCEETQVRYNVSTNASGYNMLETNDALPTNSSGDTSIYLKYTGFTIAQVNADSFGVIFWMPDGFGGDCTNYIDFIQATAYFHDTATAACTLGIISTLMTELTDSTAQIDVDIHCGVDTVLIELDTNNAYTHDFKTATNDTTFSNTATGLFPDTWYARIIAYYGTERDTAYDTLIITPPAPFVKIGSRDNSVNTIGQSVRRGKSATVAPPILTTKKVTVASDTLTVIDMDNLQQILDNLTKQLNDLKHVQSASTDEGG